MRGKRKHSAVTTKQQERASEAHAAPLPQQEVHPSEFQLEVERLLDGLELPTGAAGRRCCLELHSGIVLNSESGYFGVPAAARPVLQELFVGVGGETLTEAEADRLLPLVRDEIRSLSQRQDPESMALVRTAIGILAGTARATIPLEEATAGAEADIVTPPAACAGAEHSNTQGLTSGPAPQAAVVQTSGVPCESVSSHAQSDATEQNIAPIHQPATSPLEEATVAAEADIDTPPAASAGVAHSNAQGLTSGPAPQAALVQTSGVRCESVSSHAQSDAAEQNVAPIHQPATSPLEQATVAAEADIDTPPAASAGVAYSNAQGLTSGPAPQAAVVQASGVPCESVSGHAQSDATEQNVAPINQQPAVAEPDLERAGAAELELEGLAVLPELDAVMPPLSDEERAALEQSILADGCRDPIVVWRHGGQRIIVDGHNRYRICCSHHLPYRVVEQSFDSIADAKTWMMENAVGRRNLSQTAREYFIGACYIRSKHQGRRASGQNDQKSTASEDLAKQHGLGERTVRRYAEFAKAVDNLAEKYGFALKDRLLAGRHDLSREAIIDLANSQEKYWTEVVALLETGRAADVLALALRKPSLHEDHTVTSIPDSGERPQLRMTMRMEEKEQRKRRPPSSGRIEGVALAERDGMKFGSAAVPGLSLDIVVRGESIDLAWRKTKATTNNGDGDSGAL